MLAGIGSPGTLQAVFKGYIGSKDYNAAWIESTLQLVDKSRFDVLGTSGARPFEVATVRLQVRSTAEQPLRAAIAASPL
jgi:hypothetical protein